MCPGALDGWHPLGVFSLSDPTFVTDPYPGLAAARESGPVLWHDELGLWVTTTARGRQRRPARPSARPDLPGAVDSGRRRPVDDLRLAARRLDPRLGAAQALPPQAARRRSLRTRPHHPAPPPRRADRPRPRRRRRGPARRRRPRRRHRDVCRAAARPRHLRAAGRAGRRLEAAAGLEPGDRRHVRGRPGGRRRGDRAAGLCRVRRLRRGARQPSVPTTPATTCSPPSCRPATAATGSHRASSSRPWSCCSTPGTRRASTRSATGWGRCSPPGPRTPTS